LQYDIEKLVSKLLHKELVFASKLEQLRQDMAQSGYNGQELFDLIDQEGRHYVD
jgi:hypothetical protein